MKENKWNLILSKEKFQRYHIKLIAFSLLFFLLAMNCLINLTLGVKNYDQSRVAVEDPITKEKLILNIQQFTEFSQEIPIFGYKLNCDDLNPIDRDENGLLIFFQYKFNYVDIILELECGDFSYKDLPIYGEILIYQNYKEEFCYYIKDPLRGFFMVLNISRYLTYIDLAFDGGNCQLCYNGFLQQGYDTIESYFGSEIEIIYLDKVKNESKETIDVLINKEKEKQNNNIYIYKNKTANIATVPLGWAYRKYGIAHEVLDASYVNLAEDLPGDYWMPYTGIDVGIYRRSPSKVTILSDLQYYNKNYFPYYFRDIKAYAIYAHGHPDWYTSWAMNDMGSIKLYYYEVEELWYIDGEISVYPFGMHIHATVCYGYSGTNDYPYMAKAFVDYGAEVFVGATVDIPLLHNDDFTSCFWYDLCQSDKTVYQATMSYISRHNDFDDYGASYLNIDWVYGTHIKIYGDVNSKIGN